MPQQQAEYMTCTPLRDERQIPLAPRAPSIHEPVEGRAALASRGSTLGTSPGAGKLTAGLEKFMLAPMGRRCLLSHLPFVTNEQKACQPGVNVKAGARCSGEKRAMRPYLLSTVLTVAVLLTTAW